MQSSRPTTRWPTNGGHILGLRVLTAYVYQEIGFYPKGDFPRRRLVKDTRSRGFQQRDARHNSHVRPTHEAYGWSTQGLEKVATVSPSIQARL